LPATTSLSPVPVGIYLSSVTNECIYSQKPVV
jgi:hypothetical protein